MEQSVREENRVEEQNPAGEEKITDFVNGNYCVQMLLKLGKTLTQMFAEVFFSTIKSKSSMKAATGPQRTKILSHLTQTQHNSELSHNH